MKNQDRERIVASFTLALLVHLVLGVVLYFTTPWTTDEESEYRPPVRVVFDQPELEEPEPEEPDEPAIPEPEPDPPPEPEPEPTPDPEPAPAPTPQVEPAPAPEPDRTPTPTPDEERAAAPRQAQPRQPRQPETPRDEPPVAEEPWDIPVEDSAEPASPPPQRSLSRDALRGETIPEGTEGEFLAEQQEQMRREFEELTREIDRIEELQDELLAARERQSSSGETSSAQVSDLQRRLDQALSDLASRGEEDAVVRVGPEGEPRRVSAGEGPQTSGGRGLLAGSPRPNFSDVRWREGLPGEIVVTVRFTVDPGGNVVGWETVPNDLTLLAGDGLREAIRRTVSGWRFEASSSAGAREVGRVVYVIER